MLNSHVIHIPLPAFMARQSKASRPPWAQAIRKRRLELDLTQEKLAARTQEGREEDDPRALAQTTVSALERGEFEIGKMSALKTASLLEALGWSPLEFEEQTGISAVAVEAYYRGGTAVTDEGPQVAYLGEVSAGNGNSVSDRKMVSVPTWIAERYDLRDVFAMAVSGTSMVCEQVEKTIPEGSLVYFHARLKPQPGEVVCCYLQREDMQVIKIYKPERKYTILESYNPEMRDRPITVDESEPGILKGVYLSHEVRGPRYNR